MSEYAYQMENDLTPMVDRIAEQIQHKVDQAALDKIANTLEQYGYVKVVRCGDCKHYNSKIGCFPRCIVHGANYMMPDDFCSHGKRKEN